MNANTVRLTEADMAPIVAVRIAESTASINPRIMEKMTGMGYTLRHTCGGLYAEFVLSAPRPFDSRVRSMRYLTGSFVGRCKECKKPVRSEGALDNFGGHLHAACGCGKFAVVQRIKGRVTEHKCGARCRSSTGPNCDCSCGGANHGCG
jgi:hypothetical protein